jgi:hypothetical protein
VAKSGRKLSQAEHHLTNVVSRKRPTLLIGEFNRNEGLPLIGVRLLRGVREVELDAAAKGITVRVVPPVPGDAILPGPLNQGSVAGDAIQACINQTGIATCWEDARYDAGVAGFRGCDRDATSTSSFPFILMTW